MQIEYDPAKRAWTLANRNLDFEDSPLVWAGPHFDYEDTREDYGEVRVRTIGYLRRRMVMMVWTQGLRHRRVISMRKCDATERKKYHRYIPSRS